MGQKSGPGKLPAEHVVKAIRRATRRSRLFPQRSPPRLFTVAACGSLKPAPDGRLRGAYPHLLCSSALPLLVVGSRRTHIDVPVWAQALAGVKGRECAVGKGPEVGPIDCVGEISIDLHTVRPFLPSEVRRRGPKRRRINSSSSSIDAFSAAAGSEITRA